MTAHQTKWVIFSSIYQKDNELLCRTELIQERELIIVENKV